MIQTRRILWYPTGSVERCRPNSERTSLCSWGDLRACANELPQTRAVCHLWPSLTGERMK